MAFSANAPIAADGATEYLSEGKAQVALVRDRFERAILESVKGAAVDGTGAARIPNTSSLSFEGIESPAAFLLLHRHRICCSAESACRTGSQEASYVLCAMDSAGDCARRTLRFSFGRFNTDTQIAIAYAK